MPVLALLLALLAGCAGTSEPSDGKPLSAQQERCVKLLRDLRLYCDEGLRGGDRAATGMDCLSRRLELERACF